MKVRFSPRALDRIVEIEAHLIEMAGPQVAARVVHSFKTRARLLATNPNLGRVVVELADPALRELVITPYRMVYEVRADEGVIAILTVLHGRQMLPIDLRDP